MFFAQLALVLLTILILDVMVAFVMTLFNEGNGEFKTNFKSTTKFSAITVSLMAFFILIVQAL